MLSLIVLKKTVWLGLFQLFLEEYSFATQYIRNRQYEGTKTYPQVTEQLDQLFRDITAGKFGNDAKTGEWYIAIKEVKDTNPKPS